MPSDCRHPDPRAPRRRASALPAGAALAAGLLLAASGGCGYSFRSQLPPHLRTIYIPTLGNETSEFGLTQLLTDALTREFLNRSALTPGTEDGSDAELRATITGFAERAVTFESGEDVTVFTRQVVISLDVELVDRVENEVLWSDPNLNEFGEFTEEEGRERGVDRAVVKIAETILSRAAEDF